MNKITLFLCVAMFVGNSLQGTIKGEILKVKHEIKEKADADAKIPEELENPGNYPKGAIKSLPGGLEESVCDDTKLGEIKNKGHLVAKEFIDGDYSVKGKDKLSDGKNYVEGKIDDVGNAYEGEGRLKASEAADVDGEYCKLTQDYPY